MKRLYTILQSMAQKIAKHDQIGTMITRNASNINLNTASIDSYKEYCEMTLTKGKWIISGRWVFNTRGSADCNKQVAIRNKATESWAARVRVHAYSGNYSELEASTILDITEPTIFTLCGSSSVATVTSRGYDSCYMSAILVGGVLNRFLTIIRRVVMV